ncbi:WHEP-TRS domain-containing protein [Chloropicon primus]|uniref:WHEP-TRS domain-containing protein n=2 Tax=Chloropicon primus TaxID=1764295 RepID=A0A5B8MH02_9CHLO|nr:hypothetical protein A3770_02p11500 [Chloropicon primus]UPQ97841.1 WHEP-TRS domain-containing protein [Chloropicon primus]|eukprot:QDZ18632.1 hypothetical protein A3770_02p11500 [Chloropicon primus]
MRRVGTRVGTGVCGGRLSIGVVARWASREGTQRVAQPGRLLLREGTRRVSCGAKKKKKGGGKKGGGKKVSALDAVLKKKENEAEDEVAAAHTSVDTVMWLLLVVESFTKALGRTLLEEQCSITEIADKVYEAPFVLLSHVYGEGGEGVREHKFNYANRRALELWETEWADLVGKPSSVSGEDAEEIQSDRDELLLECKEKGFVEGYEGWRISAKGKKFFVKGATLWEVKSSGGESVGQAVVLTEWEDEEGAAFSTLDGAEAAAESPGPALSVEEAQKAVKEQGDVVRDLKASGLTNGDEEVQEAVRVLLERKADLERLQPSG